MKKQLAVMLCVLMSGLLMAGAIVTQTNKTRPVYAPNLVKIMLATSAITQADLPAVAYESRNSFRFAPLDKVFKACGGTHIIRAHIKPKDSVWEKQTGFDRWFLVKLDGSRSVQQAMAAFKASPYVEEAIPEFYAYSSVVPNDTYYPNNWGHNNTAQLPAYQGGSHSGAGVGTVGFDSDAQLAWEQQQGYGSASIIIAVIDTGADLLHPDLRLVAGYDYGDNDSNPTDNSAEKGHGTSCSGVAAAKANNALGVAGIGAGCSVMPLKVANSAGDLAFTSIENALIHCGDNDVDIASMSFGATASYGSNPSTDQAVDYAFNHGVVLFAATGNNNTSSMHYPANHPSVIAVGAASPTGQRKSNSSSDGEYWWGSNYGINTQDAANAVDIMAPTILPATDISGASGYSSTDYYMWFNGTSCATPYAAGVAGLILSKDPTLTNVQVRNIITSTARDMTIDGGEGWDRYTGYGLVNANAALLAVTPGMPLCTITAPGDNTVFDVASLLTINVAASDPDGSITNVQFFIDDAPTPVFTDADAPYSYVWDTMNAALGSHIIKAVATDNENNARSAQITITLVLPADEGFEAGNFSSFMWNNSSLIPWTVQNASSFSGMSAAQAGAVGLSDSTSLSIKLNIQSTGNISFYKKIASTVNHGFLRFYINDQLQDQWSGTGDWAMHSFAANPGLSTFKWTYFNDNNAIGGSDTAWIDQINFPPHQTYFSPPQFVQAAAGNGFVIVSWQPPEAGIPTAYKVFRDNNLLTTLSELRYVDSGLTNGTEYTYTLIAVFASGESNSTASVSAIPSPQAATEVVIGTANNLTLISDASPINQIYRSLHGQSVYTATELNAPGIFGPINITKIGFYINSAPTWPLPDFTIRMKHTSATNVINWQGPDELQTVFTASSYVPTAGGYDLLTLDTPFVWNGVDNIVIDTSFGRTSAASATGTVQSSPCLYGYRYTRNNSANQANVFIGGSTANYRPNIKLSVEVEPTEPIIEVSTTSLDFGGILLGNSALQTFSISNTGASDLSGEITAPEGFELSFARSKSTPYRSTLAYSISPDSTTVFSLSFAPIAAGDYSGEVVITHNAEGESRTISVSGFAKAALAAPFIEGFEAGLNDWTLLNGTETNTWVIGDSTSHTGEKAAYISANGGQTYGYNVNSPSLVYLYRDIAIPSVADSYFLRFVWKAKGEGSGPYYDFLRVFLVDPSTPLTPGAILSVGQLGSTLNNSELWQSLSLEIPPASYGQSKRLVFMWKNDSSQGYQPPAAIDNIRITEAQSDYAYIVDGAASIALPAVMDNEANLITPSLEISGLSSDAGYITAVSGYNSLALPNPWAGLDIKVSGADFSAAHFTLHHNLGYEPSCLFYKVGSDGPWLLYHTSPWTNTTAPFALPAGYENATEISFVFPQLEPIVPPYLSSITATLNANNNVLLQWEPLYVNGVQGYYVWGSVNDDLPNATLVSPYLLTTPEGEENGYSYTDSLCVANTVYYYWLQATNDDGMNSFFGPVSITTGDDPIIIPVPQVSQLIGNYPNPFKQETKLHYALSQPAEAEFTIYNSRGQVVFRQKVNQMQPGYFDLPFAGLDKHGRPLSSGIYYVHLRAGNQSSTRKMLLVK